MIGVISNSRAGKNAGDPTRLERLRQILDSDGVIREAQTYEEISHIAREFRCGNINILAIDGGDGTLHHALSAFIPIYNGTDLPPIALLRGGTMNTIAHSLGIRGASEAILQRIVSTVREQVPLEVVRTNALKVNDRYGFIFGLGFPVNLLKAYYRGRGRGPTKAIRVLLRVLVSMLQKGDRENSFFHPFEAEIWLDGERLPRGRYAALLGTTVNEVGLGFKPTRRAGEKEGLFQTLCLGTGSKKIGLNALRVLLGMELRGDRLVDRMVTRSVIKLERPADIQIDGEIFKNQEEVGLHIGPVIRCIRTRPLGKR
jgi:diacylglycerol kinase (ATP)